MWNGVATVDNSVKVSLKLKIELSYDQEVAHGYTQRIESGVLKRCLSTHVHSSIVHIAKMWKQSKCPSMDEWITKMWYVSTME